MLIGPFANARVLTGPTGSGKTRLALEIAERLDAEIHKMLQAYKYEITMGRLNYDELYRKLRNKLIAERRVVL